MPVMSITPLILYAPRFPWSFVHHARQLLDNARYRAACHADVAKMPYCEYLQTDVWRLTRDLLLIRQSCCERCGRKSTLEIHHLSYERIGLEVLHLGDLQVLCADCHAAAETPPFHETFGCDLCAIALWLPSTPAQLWFPARPEKRVA